jgi:SAM-dependent methyltransferase
MEEKIANIRDLVDKLRDIIGDLDHMLTEEPNAQSTEEPNAQLMDLVLSEDWPEAVYSIQIADEKSEVDKNERAESIADILLPDMEGLKFLDFGCGEGHVANYVSKESSLSVGYEIDTQIGSIFSWENKTNGLLLTIDFEKVKAEGPYDVILIYDVLDHVKTETQVEALSKAESVLSEKGRIYMRCHPWCGRHGGHVYKKLNKAFVHLVLTEEELAEMGVKIDCPHRSIRPLASYESVIAESNLVMVSEPEVDRQEVESFFESPLIKKRICKSMDVGSWSPECPLFQMSQSFVDYVLKKK